jgi:hypothetical protein
VVPGAAVTSIALNTPALPSISSDATDSWNQISRVPPRLSRPPLYSAMPTTVKFFFGCSVSTPASWPTDFSAAFASAPLITISFALCGARPSRRRSRLFSPVQFSPSRGGPNVCTVLPLGPIIRAPSATTRPFADATPGTAATFATISAEMPSVASSVSSDPPLILETGRTSTSVFW